MTKSVVFFFRGGRAALRERIAEGQVPAEFLYGMDAFERSGWHVQLAEAAPGDSRWIRRLIGPVERSVSRWLAASFTLSNALVHWEKTRRADCLVSTADGNMLALLVLRKLGFLRGRIIGITQGLYESRRRLDQRPSGALAARQLGTLLAQADALVVFGQGDLVALQDHFGEFGLPPVEINEFGADHVFWTPGDQASSPDAPILSVGSDHLRDYDTLLKAAGNLPLRIVTRRALDPALIGPRVVVDGEIDDIQLRELYRSCRFTVISTKNEPRDSGHSATVQAMACGKAVILSDTTGLWNRELLRHGETCWLVPPGDSLALRDAMDHLSSHPELATQIGRNARALIERCWTSDHFGQRLVDLATRLSS